jgi:hypothetical protein
MSKRGLVTAPQDGLSWGKALLSRLALPLALLLLPTLAPCDDQVEPFRNDFTYLAQEQQPSAPACETNFIVSLALRLGDNGFDLVSYGRSHEPKDLVVSRLDAILISQDFQSLIYVKLGESPSRKSAMNTVLQIGTDYLYHGLSRAGVPYAILFQRVPLSMVRSLLGEVVLAANESAPDTRGLHGFPGIGSWLESNALAADVAHCGDETVPAAPSDVTFEAGSETFLHYLANNRLQASYFCLVNVIRGAGDATPLALWDLLTPAASTPGMFWGDVQSFGNVISGVSKAILHLAHGSSDLMTQDLKNFMQRLDRLDEKTKTSLLCRVSSMVVTAGAITALAAGAPAPIEEVAVAAALTKISTEGRFAALLSSSASAATAAASKTLAAAGKTSGLTDTLGGLKTGLVKLKSTHPYVKGMITGGYVTSATEKDTVAFLKASAPPPPPRQPDEDTAVTVDAAKIILVDALCEVAHGSDAAADSVGVRQLHCARQPVAASTVLTESRQTTEIQGSATLAGIQLPRPIVAHPNPLTRKTAQPPKEDPQLSALTLKALYALSANIQSPKEKDERTRLTEMHNLIKFVRTNSFNYTAQNALAQQGPEVLKGIYNNPEMPDEIRKMAYNELTKFAGQILGSFETTKSLKKELLAENQKKSQKGLNWVQVDQLRW